MSSRLGGVAPQLKRSSVASARVALCFLAAGLPAVLLAQAEPTPPSGAWNHPVLHAGPMVGTVTETTARFWVRTKRPASVQVIATATGSAGSATKAYATPAVRTDAAGDLCATVELTGLPYGTAFGYRLLLNGQPVALPWATTFRTWPHWRWRTDPPAIRIALGSCAYTNDPVADRPPPPYGGDARVYSAILDAKPDLMLWLGDNCYLREPDLSSPSGIAARYARTRATPELQPLLAATQHLAIWDDHDYGPNDSDRTFPLKDTSLATFRRYWPNPGAGTRDTPGIFFRHQIGDIDLFALDDRYHRAPNATPRSDPTRTLLGEAQLHWLIDGLTSSKAPIKLVALGNQVLNGNHPYESFAHYHRDYQRLMDALEERRIGGVIFVSGDRHHSELLRLERGELYPLHELTASPLRSGVHQPRGAEKDMALRVPGTLVDDARSFGLIELSGPRNARVLALSVRDASGKERFRQEIPVASLQVR